MTTDSVISREIRGRPEYLADTLGVDAIWLSPFFEPMKNWCYVISDHTTVDPLFGNLDDATALIERAHDLGLKVMVDRRLAPQYVPPADCSP